MEFDQRVAVSVFDLYYIAAVRSYITRTGLSHAAIFYIDVVPVFFFFQNCG